MSRFLNKQLTSAESKPLGRTERRWEWDPATGRGEDRQYRCDSAERPPNTMSFAVPVGRIRGVAKPGEESAGERYSPPSYGLGIVAPAGRRRKK